MSHCQMPQGHPSHCGCETAEPDRYSDRSYCIALEQERDYLRDRLKEAPRQCAQVEYVPNIEPYSQPWLSLPFCVLVMAPTMFGVIYYELFPWLLIGVIACGFTGCYLLSHIEMRPMRKAHALYHESLKQYSLLAKVRAANDPNRPAETKTLIREHLNKQHPGWHEQISIQS